MFKINESIIVIQAEAINPIQTNVVFWSHDRGTAKLRMKLVQKDGIPQSLPEGTTVPIRLIFRSATAEGGYGKHDYLATIEDRVNGIVSIVLEDNILGYVGKVEGSVYIDFPNDRSLDTAGRFTFYIKRSPIDDSTPELEDYYFNGFSQTIDKIEKILADGKQEIDAKVKDTNDKITKANQDVATLNTNIDKANDRIDHTNQQISDLGKLKRMYSNSIDFGGYDYSGNPNLLPKLTANDFRFINTAATGYTKTDNVTYMKVTKTAGAESTGLIATVPRIKSNETYTLSVSVKALTDIVAGGLTFTLRWKDNANVTQTADAFQGQVITTTETTFSKTFTTGVVSDGVAPSLQLYFNGDLVGENEVDLHYDIKLEKGSTATPYQPNLLDAPYYLSKVALGENIAVPTAEFPITRSIESLYAKNALEDFILGETYTVTIGATMPASQYILVYLAQKQSGRFKPVEGLVDTWVATVSITQLGSNPKLVYLQQNPRDSLGSCTIKWLKIEKGDTRTPNISQFKYFGEGLKDSNNPNDYSWDVTPEYAEKALTNTLNLTDPQTALGLKNFKDGVQIDGVDVATVKNLGSVLQSGSGLTTIQSDKQSAFDEFSYEFERIGDRVFFHARVKTNSTTAVASHVNLLEIPLGFQFPIGWTIVGIPLSVVQWTTPQGEISALVITDSNGKQVVKFATNQVGNHYISGEWRTADSYPETK
ncbi:BppU family phage baseplate upper protein [Enterococcus lactis]|uniref:BppU family phage baseplate upper protein n=1 Tax=Enterococcus lactis TaxID=357441 RepID=UPI0022E8F161|nr:BppU family phage baseplate upper protein [Enterococcus lactis]